MSEQVAKALLDIGAVGFSSDKPITFKSGIVSPVYVDNRRLPYHPAAWRIVIEGFQSLITEQTIEHDVIAGVAVGGVPHSSALGFTMGVPSVFVRKEAKEHGKGKRVEGGAITDKRVLLVEDLVTTGGSSLSGIEALREEGGIVEDMLAIVSYGFDEAKTAFDDASVQLRTLTNFHVIMRVAQQQGIFNSQSATMIADWFNDPHGWASRHNKV